MLVKIVLQGNWLSSSIFLVLYSSSSINFLSRRPFKNCRRFLNSPFSLFGGLVDAFCFELFEDFPPDVFLSDPNLKARLDCSPPNSEKGEFEKRLQFLKSLRNKKLIDDAEYKHKKMELLKQFP